MKVIPFITSIILLATAAQLSANTCEKNFVAEGDPRNGAEFSTSTTINDLGSASALGQLRAIALADGFNVLGEESTGSQGTLTIEQKNGRHPFLIYLTAVNKGTAADVSIRTKLNRRTVAKPEDIRAGMCGMVARIKTGAEGDAIAAAARAAIVPEPIVEIQPRWLAKDIYRLSKRKTAEMITAHYKGKRYLLDGTIGSPLENEGTIELWYKVTIDRNGILQTLDADESTFWPPIVCRMAPEARARAAKLQEGEFAKLTGTVSHYWQGSPSKLVLKDCRFE
ncbi:hypothetical protein [Cellvibrio sp. UBA7671]|uniref:hypothetical protein n=1 Tax=Cellvibrio sp. UBA7671 TaxID=1946312 RepID=UPI002F35E424